VIPSITCTHSLLPPSLFWFYVFDALRLYLTLTTVLDADSTTSAMSATHHYLRLDKPDSTSTLSLGPQNQPFIAITETQKLYLPSPQTTITYSRFSRLVSLPGD
jgi:hypothetical protein